MNLAATPPMAERVVVWQSRHGRNHLPWQNTRDPYRVWLSEIMLQQTQVQTVLGYYARFLERFPDVASLAAAQEDEVLSLWAGLGYYSRARNLHRCAQMVVVRHAGRFPESVEQLTALPGIGRSTAGAIAAFCFSHRVPILDANVRRVLTRYLAYGEDLAQPRHERHLWAAAEQLLPQVSLETAMPRYTQGLMDLGAQICTPRQPRCDTCPLQSDCRAAGAGDAERYPVRTRAVQRRSEPWWLLVCWGPDQSLWLERRPSRGIWGGLHCPPVVRSAAEADAWCARAVGTGSVERTAPVLVHQLTHRELHLHTVVVRWPDLSRLPGLDGRWHAVHEWRSLGMPAPLRGVLQNHSLEM
ncbi:A/G-specific adenine glycosylase [Acidovorax lacteus]|uniref:Adenine DNA glycosylase n=1 Tax=Acidovorax lacteus TaxID=1924988 RepID=A0ABP8L7R1_9BURK